MEKWLLSISSFNMLATFLSCASLKPRDRKSTQASHVGHGNQGIQATICIVQGVYVQDWIRSHGARTPARHSDTACWPFAGCLNCWAKCLPLHYFKKHFQSTYYTEIIHLNFHQHDCYLEHVSFSSIVYSSSSYHLNNVGISLFT